MRFLIAVTAASFVLLPMQGIAAPQAGATAPHAAMELLAKTKKKVVKKKKAPKVEYLRAAPSK